MANLSSPTLDLSRPRLKQIAHWIRDELDPVVAREGPDLLRADDLLTLHDIFQALMTSSSITSGDLRAAGIHRAVMEIAGMATRWPGRLADDCDRLIEIWTAKYGRLEDLHPFLYGRGGRLEGIASIHETSNAALLKRWQATCPDRISKKRAHRRGAIGFQPGSWWINPIFACYDGIIDVDIIDGGVCHDKYGAYAVLLVEGLELDAPTESTLTFRCAKEDSGKFRLTAATPRSREPIRILRSHNVNSMWGPRAGVRYEGLYRVTGWVVHQPKIISTSAGQNISLGGVTYDIHFERCDPVSTDEVAKYPTASMLDDYSEYKRLRKVHRELRSKVVTTLPEVKKVVPMPAKVAPAIPPVAPVASGAKSLFASTPQKPSPAPSKDTLEAAPGANIKEDAFPAHKSPGNLVIPPLGRTETSHSDALRVNAPNSNEASSVASTSKSHQSVIKEVAPWIDYDLPHLEIPPATNFVSTKRSTTHNDVAPDQPNGPTSMNRKATRKKSEDRSHLLLRPSPSGQTLQPAQDLNKKESRKSVLFRSRNPMAKLFDGTEDGSSKTNDYFSIEQHRVASANPEQKATASGGRARATSTGGTPQPVAPTPVKQKGPNPLLLDDRRDAVAFPSGYSLPPTLLTVYSDTALVAPRQSLEDPFVGLSPLRITEPLPVSLKDFLQKDAPTTNSSTEASPRIERPVSSSPDVATRRAQAAGRLKKIVKDLEELQVKVAFRDPFGSTGHNHERKRTDSSNVPPETSS
ncbi:hypothetical protein BU23DRAFT_594360 [Bimuria novae-zelandiae CBS 107.79]|uniref:YDG domain-containing protein n=1 Tax=Bimuria novae-zelandiae CBS 107.79 TaxID=1447943 RepID=A0A6A5VSV8_9PLEO|nr:hypothetical protein BU23DRAFT_594360 [Bimuria novae-zelandiae CBS 107.79]